MSEQRNHTFTTNSNHKDQNLVIVKNLVKYYPVRAGILRRIVDWIQAVDGVDFEIKTGETLGLVGESGCGKSTIGRTILHLLEPTDGYVEFDGTNIFDLQKGEIKQMRRNMQIIFQDPFSSLNPRRPVGDSIMAGLKIHKIGNKQERLDILRDTMHKVGLAEYHAQRYPHEFSGGQRQRIAVARAIATNPEFIVLDEPTSALDVSVQAQILNLLIQLQQKLGLTYLFVTHHLLVVKYISSRLAVMYLGKIIEISKTNDLFARPLHPYTYALLSGIPVPDVEHKQWRIVLSGDVPSPLNPPAGCRFHTRCPFAVDRCLEEEPPLEFIESGHQVACHLKHEMDKLITERFGYKK